MNDGSVAKRIKTKREALEKRRELHAKNTKERAKAASDIKAAYMAAANDPVLLDVLAKAKAFCAYHIKVAKDGVGTDIKGALVYHSNERRVSELDRAAGIQSLIDYIERQLEEVPDPLAVEEGDPSDGEAEDLEPEV